MADTISEVEYRYVIAEDRPGEGARIFKELSSRGVNLLAALGFPIGDGRSQVDLFPEDPEALNNAAREAGLQLSGPKKAFLVTGADRVGVAEEYCRKLGDAGVNITALMATTAGEGRFGMVIWVAADDLDRARRALGL
jgi:predicted amino acid-binding ACT domain protein